MKNFTEFLNSYNNKDIKSDVVIFGAGTIGRLTFGALKNNKLLQIFFAIVMLGNKNLK